MKNYTIQTGLKNSILRKKAEKITVFNSGLKKFEKILLNFATPDNAAGIAAPQIGESIQMIICKLDGKKLTTMCNPEITFFSEEKKIAEEGCLSLPGIWGKVERSTEIIVKYQDIKGKEIQLKLKGFAAKLVQHELDHLHGVLFFDRILGNFEYEKGTDLKALGISQSGDIFQAL